MAWNISDVLENKSRYWSITIKDRNVFWNMRYASRQKECFHNKIFTHAVSGQPQWAMWGGDELDHLNKKGNNDLLDPPYVKKICYTFFSTSMASLMFKIIKKCKFGLHIYDV